MRITSRLRRAIRDRHTGRLSAFPRIAGFAALAAAAVSLWTDGRGAAPDTPASLPLSLFSQVHSTEPGAYESGELKFTYVGTQLKNTPSLAAVHILRSGGFDRSAFVPFERMPIYANDSTVSATLALSSLEFARFIDSIAVYPALHDTVSAEDPMISVMVLRDEGGQTLCWEHQTTSPESGDLLFRLLHGAVTNPADKTTVDEFRHHMVGVRR